MEVVPTQHRCPALKKQGWANERGGLVGWFGGFFVISQELLHASQSASKWWTLKRTHASGDSHQGHDYGGRWVTEWLLPQTPFGWEPSFGLSCQDNQGDSGSQVSSSTIDTTSGEGRRGRMFFYKYQDAHSSTTGVLGEKDPRYKTFYVRANYTEARQAKLRGLFEYLYRWQAPASYCRWKVHIQHGVFVTTGNQSHHPINQHWLDKGSSHLSALALDSLDAGDPLPVTLCRPTKQL